MRDIQAVTIDLDDTLWAIAPVIRQAEAELREYFASNYPRIVEQFSPNEVRDLRDQVFAENVDQAHDLTFIRKTVIGRMGVASGYGNGLVEEAFAVFDAARNRVEPYPDVVAALNSISATCRLVAVTNGNADLERIGIAKPFDAVVSARAVGAAKPEAAIFSAAVSAGGAPAIQTLHVGDHPEHDVEGARNAGMRTAWVNRDNLAWPTHISEADIEISDLGQLVTLLIGSSAS